MHSIPQIQHNKTITNDLTNNTIILAMQLDNNNEILPIITNLKPHELLQLKSDLYKAIDKNTTRNGENKLYHQIIREIEKVYEYRVKSKVLSNLNALVSNLESLR